MHGLSIGILTALGTSIFSWYLAYDTVTCNVSGAGLATVNGYYSALGGAYFKRGSDISYFPDVFQTFTLRRDMSTGATIALNKHYWAIYSDMRKQMVYKNSPEHPQQYIYSPPEKGWVAVEGGKDPTPIVTGCRGSLQDSPPLPSGQVSNIAQLLQRPVTTFLLGVIFYVAYYLWSNRTEVSDVSYSYDAIVNEGQYWRMVTSSFSHFDAWHLLFNTMSLYQLGELEVTYGSVTFAFLNMDLVFITMAICLVFSHIMIKNFGRVDQTYQQAVGFSCVLFAWMVAASVRMKQYCPIFLFPSLCFTTYYLPNPFSFLNLGPTSALPINLGPVILLVITKVVIPRSSFLGHLSGILIGYPVAWNALNWLTPPLFFSLLALFVMYQKNLNVKKFPGYELTPDLSELGTPGQVGRFRSLRLSMWVLAALSATALFTLGPVQIVSRISLIIVIWSAVQARRCEWLTALRTAHEDCLCVLYIAAIGAAVAAVYDLSSLSASIAALDLLTGCGLSVQYVTFSMGLLSILVIAEVAFLSFLLANINDIKLSESVMQSLQLNGPALQRDLKMLGLSCLPCCGGGGESGLISRHVFDGPGRRAAGTLGQIPSGEESRLLSGMGMSMSMGAGSGSGSGSGSTSASSSLSPMDKSRNGLKLTKSEVPAPAPFPRMSDTPRTTLV
jgi:membrane associated rhomboid family serine protease